MEEEPPLTSPTPLRPLTSLKWPYVPEESAFPDPLKKNDPKPLQLSQYEAIGTSIPRHIGFVLVLGTVFLNAYFMSSYISCYSKNYFRTQKSSRTFDLYRQITGS